MNSGTHWVQDSSFMLDTREQEVPDSVRYYLDLAKKKLETQDEGDLMEFVIKARTTGQLRRIGQGLVDITNAAFGSEETPVTQEISDTTQATVASLTAEAPAASSSQATAAASSTQGYSALGYSRLL